MVNNGNPHIILILCPWVKLVLAHHMNKAQTDVAHHLNKGQSDGDEHLGHAQLSG